MVPTNKDLLVALHAAELVVSLSMKPLQPAGEPMTLTFHWGCVARINYLNRGTVAEGFAIFREASSTRCGEIANIFHEWVHQSSWTGCAARI